MPEKPNKLMPALYGGIIMGVISGIPFLNLVNCCCCAGVLLGGALSVFFYRNDLKEGMPPLTSGDALELGAIAGVIGAVISSVLSAGLLAAVGNVNGEAVLGILEGFKDQIPPEAFDEIQGKIMSGGISIFNFIGSLIIDTIFGLLGGLIGFAIFKPKPQLPTSVPMPQPPVLPPQA